MIKSTKTEKNLKICFTENKKVKLNSIFETENINF